VWIAWLAYSVYVFIKRLHVIHWSQLPDFERCSPAWHWHSKVDCAHRTYHPCANNGSVLSVFIDGHLRLNSCPAVYYGILGTMTVWQTNRQSYLLCVWLYYAHCCFISGVQMYSRFLTASSSPSIKPTSSCLRICNLVEQSQWVQMFEF